MHSFNKFTVTLAFAAVSTAGVALAGDGKVYPGSACVPYSSGSANILQRFSDYALNTSTGNSALVTCPVVKDIVGGTRLEYIRISYNKTNSSGFYCQVFSKNHSGTSFHTSSKWDSSSTGNKTMILPDVNAYGSGSVSLYCIIPPGGRITSYRVDEQ